VKNAPDYVSKYSSESRTYFDTVCNLLTSFGIDFEVDRQMVRGLDYYAHTVFEVIHSGIGAQNAIAGGGRYELYLPENRKPIVGVGFAAGLERLLMVQEALKVAPPETGKGPVFMISMGNEARAFNMKLAQDLRNEDIPVVVEVEDKSMKAQMRAANRTNSTFAVICGDEELESGKFVCKNMVESSQDELSKDELKDFLKKVYTGV
jgi:histidyl-tRNA synthetase